MSDQHRKALRAAAEALNNDWAAGSQGARWDDLDIVEKVAWTDAARIAIEAYEQEMSNRGEVSVRITVKDKSQHGVTLQAAVLVDGAVLTELHPATLYSKEDMLIVKLPEPLMVMS